MAYTSHAVDWDKLDPHTYERMVGVALNYMHPQSRRTDGAGGDDGKDVSFPGASGPIVFQLKSCTGRMDTARWAQVRRSLKRAAELKPEAWHLVLPIDFTPAEEKQFAKVVAPYSFPCDYMGLTWLDARMAEYAVVPQYFLQGGEARVLELLRELQEEQAALAGGAPDLINRLQRLAARADEIDPFYLFDFGVFDGRVSISLRPKYLGAEKDRPITVSTGFTFPDTAEGQAARRDLDAAVRYGASAHIPAAFVANVTVDAPAGLGGEHGSGEFLIKGSDVAGPPLTVKMVLVDPGDRQIASLPLTVGPRTVGVAGFQATATDPSGCLRCRLRVDGQTMNLNLAYEMELPPRCLPALAMPTLRFLAKFGAPNRFQLHFEGKGAIMPPVAVEREPLVSEAYVDLVAMFERVQARTQTFFELPASLGDEDYSELVEADKLINGEMVRGRWSASSWTMEVGPFVRQAQALGIDVFSGGRITQFAVSEYERRIAGHVIPLGVGTRILYSAELENADEVKAAYETDPTQEVEIRLRPGSNNDSSLQLGAPDANREPPSA